MLWQKHLTVTGQDCSSCGRASKTKLLLLDPGNDSHQNYDRQQDNGPEFHLQHVVIEVGLNSADHGSQKENKDCVSAPAVVLPDSLGIVLASIQSWGSPHGEANAILEKEDDRSDDAKVAVDGVKVRAVVRELVVLNNGYASYKHQKGHKVEDGVYALSSALLVSCMRRL